jgi:hypothetical protein
MTEEWKIHFSSEKPLRNATRLSLGFSFIRRSVSSQHLEQCRTKIIWGNFFPFMSLWHVSETFKYFVLFHMKFSNFFLKWRHYIFLIYYLSKKVSQLICGKPGENWNSTILDLYSLGIFLIKTCNIVWVNFIDDFSWLYFFNSFYIQRGGKYIWALIIS